MHPAPFDIEAALAVVRKKTSLAPRVGIVLGSGLGVLADGVAWEATLSTADIPGIPRSTVPGHSGRLLAGRWSGRPVVVAQGRSHVYEGLSAEEATRLVRLMHGLGVNALVLTNAAGGIAPRARPGSLLLVEDLVEIQWRSPVGELKPQNPRGLTGRPTFDAVLLEKAARAASTAGVRLERGVLGVTLGPAYETPAEIALLERMGADAVCMSTAAEAALASSLGLPVVAISCITNWAAGKSHARLSHDDVTRAVADATTPLKALLERMILATA